MRIVHVVDAAQAQAQVQERVSPPPDSAPPRRIKAVTRQAGPDDQPAAGSSLPDDGISLALSPESREAARQAALEELRASLAKGRAPRNSHASASDEDAAGGSSRDDEAVRDLEQRDRDVRSHEQAHAVAAGGVGSQPTFTYQVGPNGHLYAVSGEVKIDTSPVPGDPEATLRKAQQIEKAAFAPGDPSPEDRRAAVMAAAIAARARQELARQQEEARRAAEGDRAAHIHETG